MVEPHKGPGLLIRHPLSHDQLFRMNRGRRVRTSNGRETFVKDKQWFDAIDCRTAECDHYQNGWITVVDTGGDLGKRQAHYIRKLSGRHFKEESNGPEGIIKFSFYSEQKCFRAHDRPVDRDPRFLFLGRSGGRQVDYDEFHTTFNETVVQIGQQRREV